MSGYAHYALRLGPVTVARALRVEWFSQGFTDRMTDTAFRVDQAIALPGGSVLVDPLDTLRLFAGVHRGFTPPLPNDARTVGPEVALNYEFGGRWTDTENGVRAELTAFASDYENITSQCTLTAGCTDVDRAFNAGHAVIWGLEAGASVTVPLDHLALILDGTYTLTDSMLLTSFSSADPQLGTVEIGDRLPYVPEHQASLGAALEETSRFRVALAGTFVGAMREEAGQGAGGRRTGEQYLVDVTGSMNVGHGVSIFARLENILLQTAVASRRPWGARPIRPFQAQLGVRVDFE